ncbi:hypothetical protein OURE66S_04236 [Oligella ureolytica]
MGQFIGRIESDRLFNADIRVWGGGGRGGKGGGGGEGEEGRRHRA